MMHNAFQVRVFSAFGQIGSRGIRSLGFILLSLKEIDQSSNQCISESGSSCHKIIQVIPNMSTALSCPTLKNQLQVKFRSVDIVKRVGILVLGTRIRVFFLNN